MVLGLSESDVTQLEEKLDSGKRPSVVFKPSAGQVAGQVGKVVELATPREGDFVVVAFGRDQLPFSPEEVRLPQRGELSRKKKPPEPPPEQAPASPPPGPGLLPEDNVVIRPKAEVKKETVVTQEEKPAPKKTVPKQRKAAKDKHPELTVVLTFHEGAWEVSVSRGARKVVAATPVEISAAQKMINAAEIEAVDTVAEEVLEGVRQKARAEAEALRVQLEEAEARLAQLQ